MASSCRSSASASSRILGLGLLRPVLGTLLGRQSHLGQRRRVALGWPAPHERPGRQHPPGAVGDADLDPGVEVLALDHPVAAEHGADGHAGGHADAVGEQRHGRGVLLVVADHHRSVDEALVEPALVLARVEAGLPPEGAVGVAAALAEPVGDAEDGRHLRLRPQRPRLRGHVEELGGLLQRRVGPPERLHPRGELVGGRDRGEDVVLLDAQPAGEDRGVGGPVVAQVGEPVAGVVVVELEGLHRADRRHPREVPRAAHEERVELLLAPGAGCRAATARAGTGR